MTSFSVAGPRRIPTGDLELMDGGYILPMTAPDRCAVLIRRVAARQQAVTRVAPPDGPISDA